MTRRGFSVLALATLVLLALGASQTFAGKGGGKPGGGGPPPDPAIALIDHATGNLMVMNEDGSNVTALVTANWPVAWSSDGTQLVFTRTESSFHDDIYVINVDGTGLAELRARNDPSAARGVSWSPGPLPDGIERIAYTDCAVLGDGSLGPEQLFLMEPDGSNPMNTGRAGGLTSWSPDATRLGVTRGANGLRIHEFGVDTGGALTITASPRYDLQVSVWRVAWSKTSDDVLAVTVPNGEIWRIDLRDAEFSGYNTDGTELYTLTTHVVLASTPGMTPECDWSPDDSRLIWEYGQLKPNSGLRNWGCWIIDLGSGADPTLFYRDGFSPRWRR